MFDASRAILVIRRLLVASLALLAITAIATPFLPAHIGLRASYFDNDQWAGAPVISRRDVAPATATLDHGWPGPVPDVFSVTWSGALVVPADGTRTFALTSDDGSWLLIDGQMIVDNRGLHSARTMTGAATLTRGVHAIRIQYMQGGAGKAFAWTWSPNGEPLVPVPAWMMLDDRVSPGAAVGVIAVHLALALAEWLVVLLALAGIAVWAGTCALRGATALLGVGAPRALAILIGGSLVLNAVAIWWGLPGGHWAPDELTPFDVAIASAQHFANGWGSRYPPLHFYLMALVSSPGQALEALGRLDAAGVDVVNSIATRAVSTLAGAGTLLFLYLAARRLVGTRAALFAVAQFALAAPFVYYAKMANLDVPYIFYAAVALWAYVSIAEHPTQRDLLVFGVASAAAIGTKDQAYGLLLLPSFAILAALRRQHAEAHASWPLLRAATDRRLLVAVGVALITLAAIHNVLFNWQGFLLHINLSAGGASEGSYRMFPATWRGNVGLLRLTLDLAREAWGWPLFVTAAAGAIWMWVCRSTRRQALLLTLPIASYYLTFVTVIGFNYDRFVLPMMVPSAVFGGFLLAKLSHRTRHPVGPYIITSVFAYSVPYAAAVDVAMLRDSRYAVERFLAAQPDRGYPIGFVFPVDYYPRLDPVQAREMSTIPELRDSGARYFVLNEEYADFEPADTDRGALIAAVRSGALGYRPAFHVPGGFSFRWLPWPHGQLAGPRPASAYVTSSLRHISPTYTVYRRE